MAANDSIDPWDISDDHYSAIGKVAASWAALEAMVSSAIWQIGEIQDEIGACVTSQIFPFDGKIKALISILEVRGGLNKTICQLNKFHKDTRGIGTFRNRTIHDPWVHDLNTNTPHRLQITADKKPIMEYKPESTDKLLEHAKETAKLIERLQEILKPAIERFPALPKKSL
jgi:hypothetical protein